MTVRAMLHAHDDPEPTPVPWHRRLWPLPPPSPAQREEDRHEEVARQAVRRSATALAEEIRQDIADMRAAAAEDRLGYPLANALRRRERR